MQFNESHIYHVILHESFFSLPLFHYKELIKKGFFLVSTGTGLKEVRIEDYFFVCLFFE